MVTNLIEASRQRNDFVDQMSVRRDTARATAGSKP